MRDRHPTSRPGSTSSVCDGSGGEAESRMNEGKVQVRFKHLVEWGRGSEKQPLSVSEETITVTVDS